MKEKITKNMTLGEIATNYPEAVNILLKYGLHCIGCHIASWETLEQGANAHGLYGKEFDKLLNELNQMNQPKKKNIIDRKKEMHLEQGHPIHTLMEEHKVILEFIEKLQTTVNKIELNKSFAGLDKELKILTHIGEHLVEADKHHLREENSLFPMLKKFGVTEPPAIMEEEHKELRVKENELYKIAKYHKNISYAKFVKKIKDITGYLSKELSDHIYKENNNLYPMAIQAIPQKKWAEIKKQCDKIGYCCFTPAS